MVGYSGATRKVADMLKFPRKKVGEQGKRNRKEGKREECNEGRDGEEGKGSWGEREWDLFGRYIEKEGESTQEETKVLSLLAGRKNFLALCCTSILRQYSNWYRMSTKKTTMAATRGDWRDMGDMASWIPKVGKSCQRKMT